MKLTDDQFDVTGSEIGRTWRQAQVYGLVPVGSADRAGGPGWGICARLWLWHRFGGTLFQWVMRFEKQAIGLYCLAVRFRKYFPSSRKK